MHTIPENNLRLLFSDTYIIDKFTGKSGNVATDDDINDAIDGVAKEFE